MLGSKRLEVWKRKVAWKKEKGERAAAQETWDILAKKKTKLDSDNVDGVQVTGYKGSSQADTPAYFCPYVPILKEGSYTPIFKSDSA